MNVAALYRFAALSACCVLCACTVGPDYAPPTLDVPLVYAEAPTQPLDEPTLAHWWQLFDDPVLDDLVERALAQNLQIQVAASRINQARYQLAAAGAVGKPTLGAVASANETKISENSGLSSLASVFNGGGSGGSGGGGPPTGIALPGTTISTFSVGFDAGWEIDLFGGARRQREAAGAAVDAAVWSRRDAQVSIAAEVARTYFALRSAQFQAAILASEIEDQQGVLRIIDEQVLAGLEPGSSRFGQQSLVDTTVAAREQVVGQQRNLRQALALLLAVPAAQLPPIEPSRADLLTREVLSIPAGLPSDLLRRRPDIRAAERQLAAATAQIGIATADLYPKISLTGVVELISTSLARLVSTNSIQAIGAAQVGFPLIDFGRNRALIGSAQARADEAYLGYRQTVLAALSDVETSLATLDAERSRNTALRRSLAQTERAARATLVSYEGGLTDFTAVYQQQQVAAQARQQVISSDANIATATVALYKALGGGWRTSDAEPAIPR